MPKTPNKLEYLTENDWVLLGTKATRLKFTLGQEIIREGAPGETIYIIRKGTASVELGGSRDRTPIALLSEDDICGDIAFLDGGRTTASVVAKDEEVEVDAINAEELRHLFEVFSGLSARFYRSMAVALARRLRETSRQLARA
ncbi:MAG TPA: cyclic nucleotide-binding domain-containing protein [Terriglobales bacterium]|nr:cyclic nucleotide-binding domain-containing protein [Terriglobales bacterium]